MSFTPALDQDVKERIRQATDIVDLVGRYLPLRRQGRIYVALCPWHDDSRPSLQVNPERQSWKCWVCDVGGDVFSFLMQHERIGFRESLEMLAERAGISLQPAAKSAIAPGSPQDKKTLYQALQWAADQFQRCLRDGAEADAARRYVEQRGLTPSSVQRFGLGFAPDEWQWLLDRARAAGFPPPVLEAAGVCSRSPTGGRWHDRFRGRLMFPIRDVQGRTIAFGGRILPGATGDNLAKYINSPETALFSKSDNLYALDLARERIAKLADGQREAVVVEGYTDVIMAHQVGLNHVVAVLGTALGPRHIRLLRRFVDRVILVLDGDAAGQRRTNEILELFIAAQVDLRILTLPEDLDPCDFLLNHGAEPFQQMLDGAADALEHKVRIATHGIDLLRDTHRANRALEDILATIAKAAGTAAEPGLVAGSRLREQQVLARLARQFGLPEHALRSRLGQLRRKQPERATARHAGAPPARTGAPRTRAPSGRSAAGDARTDAAAANRRAVNGDDPSGAGNVRPRFGDLDPREIELLEILAVHPEFVQQAVREIESGQLQSETARTLYGTIHGIFDMGGTPDFGNVLTALDDPSLKNIWVELDERARAKAAAAPTDPRERLQGLVDAFQYATMTRDRPQQLAALEQKRLDDQEELAVLQSLIDQERSRHGISAPKEG